MKTKTFIPELLEIAKESSLSVDEVFIIAYDNGLIDKLGNVTLEVSKVKNSDQLRSTICLKIRKLPNHDKVKAINFGR